MTGAPGVGKTTSERHRPAAVRADGRGMDGIVGIRKHLWVAVKAAVERRGDRLRGWACRIRTSESVREPPNWICVTTSAGGRRRPRSETLRVRAALYGFAAPAKIQQAILARPAW